MSVLKKIQFADASIIGAGMAECQKPVRVTNALRVDLCSIAVR
jgi:hypothetical protein